jgi:hypothetical protein
MLFDPPVNRDIQGRLLSLARGLRICNPVAAAVTLSGIELAHRIRKGAGQVWSGPLAFWSLKQQCDRALGLTRLAQLGLIRLPQIRLIGGSLPGLSAARLPVETALRAS